VAGHHPIRGSIDDVTTQQDSRAGASLQLGVQKYLYTGFFVAGCILAYLAHNVAERVLG